MVTSTWLLAQFQTKVLTSGRFSWLLALFLTKVLTSGKFSVDY